MAAPKFVPVVPVGAVRSVELMPPPEGWRAERPAEVDGPPRGPGMGTPGPDQGYALKLARRFDGRLRLAEGEHHADAVAGCLGIALRRAALFSRAPVVHDLTLAFELFGFMGDAPPDLLAERRRLFDGAGHDYATQRAIAGSVPDSTLRLSPAEVRDRVLAGDWQSLFA